MSREITISELELRFLEETAELINEEFDGIEEAVECDYVLTTGAREQLAELEGMVDGWKHQMWYEDLKEEEEIEIEDPPY